MKKQLCKNGLIILCSILGFTSCVKNELADPTLIIDPSPWYTNNALWLEAEKRIGDADQEPILEGNSLFLNWNQNGEIITSPFYYKYNSSNLGIKVDKEGYLLMENGIMSFLKVRDDEFASTQMIMDTVVQVQYIVDGERMIIRDTTVSPVTEVIYNRQYP